MPDAAKHYCAYPQCSAIVSGTARDEHLEDYLKATRGAELFEAYGKWADKQKLSKLERLNRNDFGQRMATRFTRQHTNTGKVYHGVQLVRSTLW